MRHAVKAVLFALAAIACAGAATAQEERIFRPPGGGAVNAELILYSGANYSGPSVRVQAPVGSINLGWRVRSVRLLRGEWQACAQPNYGGLCQTIRTSIPALPAIGPVANVRSLRPAAEPEPPTPPGGGNAGPSLRGMAAEFFAAPAARGQRILACRTGSVTANCTRATAEQFCRSRGYNYARHQAAQTVSRQTYLADVLCTRS